jgi:hypothetical protein
MFCVGPASEEKEIEKQGQADDLDDAPYWRAPPDRPEEGKPSMTPAAPTCALLLLQKRKKNVERARNHFVK